MDIGEHREFLLANEQRSWICPRCQEELGELNAICEYCKANDETIIYNPDKYCVRDVFVRHIKEVNMNTEPELTDAERIEAIEANPRLTPQEKLFSQLFYHEKKLVCDMDTLTLRAHREELAKIAFEARARLTAVDDEENDRKKKSQPKGPKGFERSLNTDETTTNAINTLKDKKQRLSKSEKIKEGLLKLGIDTDEVNKIMSAKNMLSQVTKAQNHTKPESSEQTERKPIFNPFEKKS